MIRAGEHAQKLRERFSASERTMTAQRASRASESFPAPVLLTVASTS